MSAQTQQTYVYFQECIYTCLRILIPHWSKCEYLAMCTGTIPVSIPEATIHLHLIFTYPWQS